jgi:hypothetical protein
MIGPFGEVGHFLPPTFSPPCISESSHRVFGAAPLVLRWLCRPEGMGSRCRRVQGRLSSRLGAVSPVIWSATEPVLRIQIWMLGLLSVVALLLWAELVRDGESPAPPNKGMQIPELQQSLGVAKHPLAVCGGGERRWGDSFAACGSWGLRRRFCSCAVLSPSLAGRGGEGRSGETVGPADLAGLGPLMLVLRSKGTLSGREVLWRLSQLKDSRSS